MPDRDSDDAPPPGRVAQTFMESARAAMNPTDRVSRALVSIAASLVNQADDRTGDIARIEREAYDRGDANAADRLYGISERMAALRAITADLESDQPENTVRWMRAFLQGREFPAITPEEPELERDWSRVKAHLFNPRGKWKYQVFLDYTGERHQGVSGEGPAGWHYDGHEMAKRALYRATRNGTSGVTISALAGYWHLFVPDPPQGFPHWVQPGDPDEEVDV